MRQNTHLAFDSVKMLKRCGLDKVQGLHNCLDLAVCADVVLRYNLGQRNGGLMSVMAKGRADSV